jgi:hypothetical protein
VKRYWEIIAENLSNLLDAHRDNGKRFFVRSDEMLSAHETKSLGKRLAVVTRVRIPLGSLLLWKRGEQKYSICH